MTYKEIYDIAVPEKKRKEERWNIWVTIAVRPLSVLMTIPLAKTKVKPTTITKWPVLSLLLGAAFIIFGSFPYMTFVGWLFFFLWAILDGVDGNLARATNQCSYLGDLWDTLGGYLAMIMMYYTMGIYAFFDNNLVEICDKYLILLLGGITAMICIFPRLILHKKKSYGVESSAVKEYTDTTNFSFSKVIAANIIAPSGFMQIIFLAGLFLHITNIIFVGYFVINLVIMIVSLYRLLSE